MPRRLEVAARGDLVGYLLAGLIIGPHALGLVPDSETTHLLAELGVVFLLFVIGLELEPARIWAMRRTLFGLGSLQVVLTGLALAGVALAIGRPWQAALVLGFGLALSSTAFVLQLLAERDELATEPGRAALAILLLQDMAVIPLLALVPLLAPGSDEPDAASIGWRSAIRRRRTSAPNPRGSRADCTRRGTACWRPVPAERRAWRPAS